jgi:hypothetical protein
MIGRVWNPSGRRTAPWVSGATGMARGPPSASEQADRSSVKMTHKPLRICCWSRVKELRNVYNSLEFQGDPGSNQGVRFPFAGLRKCKAHTASGGFLPPYMPVRSFPIKRSFRSGNIGLLVRGGKGGHGKES